MPSIRFEPGNVTLEVAVGQRLVDVSDQHPEVEVPYSCRSASCGTCRVRVLVGLEAFAPPEDEELDVLDVFGHGADTRLCCQLRVVGEVPRVVLRVIAP